MRHDQRLSVARDRRLHDAVLVTMLTFVLLALFGQKGAEACDCDPMPPERALERADVVFVGEAAQTRGGEVSGTGARFQVSEVHKGRVHEVVEVATDDTSCAYTFEEGREEIVYASERYGRLTTAMCEGTTPLEQGEDHVLALGEGEAPLSGTSGEAGWTSVSATTIGIVVAALGTAVGVLFIRRGRRS